MTILLRLWRQLRRRIGLSMLTWLISPKLEDIDSSGRKGTLAVLAFDMTSARSSLPLNELEVMFGKC